MAEPLKDSYGPAIPRRIGAMIAAVHPAFDERAFVRDALRGYEALELMPRGRHIARALHGHLPRDFPEAARILVASMDAPSPLATGHGLAPFLYMPHAFYVAEHGLEHFEAAMAAQHAITQRFTAEFSIRPFLERDAARTLERLHEWTRDPSEHVRRLVSEGTRPRLPWAPRLAAFQRDPAPVLELLEKLRDDPSLYVRRSVANNLNDIGKDHPGLLVEVCRRWMEDAPPGRQWVVRHALRGAVKRGDLGALRVLGFAGGRNIAVEAASITPSRAAKGGSIRVSFDVANATRRTQRAVVDFRIHYVKASGRASPKVFKMKAVTLAPGARESLAKKVSLADMTTRRHHAGRHAVEALVNGRVVPLGSFLLQD